MCRSPQANELPFGLFNFVPEKNLMQGKRNDSNEIPERTQDGSASLLSMTTYHSLKWRIWTENFQKKKRQGNSPQAKLLPYPRSESHLASNESLSRTRKDDPVILELAPNFRSSGGSLESNEFVLPKPLSPVRSKQTMS